MLFRSSTLFGTITHLSSLNIFQLFVGPIYVPCVAFTLYIYFFPSTPSTQTHRTSEKKKKKKKKKKEKVKATNGQSLLSFHHPSLITQFSSLIT